MNTIERALAKKKQKQKQSIDDADKNLSADNSHLGEVDATENKLAEPNLSDSEQSTHLPVTTPDNESQNDFDSSQSLTLDINLPALEERGFVSTTDSRRLVNEEYRAIKRKVLNNAFGPLSDTLNNANVIMVSSPRPNDGKTFTAINLALSIALEQDKTVLLVDADVLRPSVMRELGAEFDKGLMEYLLGDVTSLSEVMYSTNIEKLKVIPAGKSHHLSTELLASEKMWETVKEFSKRYSDRVVIFDTPPLLGINETAILANLAGQAVIVLKENNSKISDVNEAVQQLNPDMSKGFVVNQSTHSVNGSGYYGYYYSGNAK